MGQITGAALRAADLPETKLSTARAQERVRAQAIVSAVHVLNQSGFAGADREVTYSQDSATKQLIVQVVDKDSKAVVVQWPSDYALEMAQEFQKEHPEK